ncbi:MAG: hydroxyisourate hydrolase [Rhizobiaceae bacterium]
MGTNMSAGSGYLTTHVLDTARGCPAEGIPVTLYRISEGKQVEIASAVTNSDGRTDGPILAKGHFTPGQYLLVFSAGDYLKKHGLVDGKDAFLFLDEIPIRFGSSDGEAHYHVPLLLSPYGFSTYRGS